MPSLYQTNGQLQAAVTHLTNICAKTRPPDRGGRVEQTGNLRCGGQRSQVENANQHDADDDQQQHEIVPPRELLAQEDAAPEHGRGAVGRDDGRGVHDVVLVRDGVDVRELAGRLEQRADVLRPLALGQEAVVPDELDIHE